MKRGHTKPTSVTDLYERRAGRTYLADDVFKVDTPDLSGTGGPDD